MGLDKYFRLFFIINSAFSLMDCNTLPATVASPTTHIVSYTKLLKSKSKNDEFSKFDFESLVDLDRNKSTNILENEKSTAPQFAQLMAATNNTNNTNSVDDLLIEYPNTLDNDIYNNSEQHESPMTIIKNGSIENWSRNKQNIPVLESVRHFVHSVRDGALNHTPHVRDQHRLLHMNFDSMHNVIHNESTGTPSSAIETEEEREMANESTSLKVLDFFGTIGGMIWSFIMNLQSVFAASSSSASASSSSSSFGSSR